jgi:carbamoyltransferase
MIVLGINHSYDAAAAVVKDGRAVAACAEERLSRVKHDASFPAGAVKYCLSAAGCSLDEVDSVAFFWNPGRHLEPMLRRLSPQPRHHAEYLYSVPNHLLQLMGSPRVHSFEQRLGLAGGRSLRIEYVTHHLCHAASAFFRSPFEEAAILTVDGYGERTSTQIAMGRGVRIDPILEVDFPHSIGSFYAAVTQFLGFKANDGEGKVMGLAAYGEPTFAPLFRRMLVCEENGFRVDLSYFSYYLERGSRISERFEAELGPPRTPESPLTQRHYDIAASLQAVTEETVLHLARIARERTGARYLTMAGGVALNCVANGLVAEEAGFERIFVHPAAGDSGTALGAALWVAHGQMGIPRPEGEEATDYLGAEFDAAAIQRELQRANLPARRVENAPREAAERLARGQIVAWFQGRAEYGPRALGNRSILADPRPAQMKDQLNARVKFREPFRPFAPSVLEERCGELFERSEPSPFMLQVYKTRLDKRDVIPAVTHIDGGARVQTVNQRQNPRYYSLIEHFAALTGVPCVLNTSFNIRGEPIVHTVSDALKCFFTTDMDALFLGDFLIERPGA